MRLSILICLLISTFSFVNSTSKLMSFSTASVNQKTIPYALELKETEKEAQIIIEGLKKQPSNITMHYDEKQKVQKITLDDITVILDYVSSFLVATLEQNVQEESRDQKGIYRRSWFHNSYQKTFSLSNGPQLENTSIQYSASDNKLFITVPLISTNKCCTTLGVSSEKK